MRHNLVSGQGNYRMRFGFIVSTASIKRCNKYLNSIDREMGRLTLPHAHCSHGPQLGSN